MGVEMIEVYLDAAKFLAGDKLRLNLSAVLSPNAEALIPDLSIDLVVFGTFQGKRGTFGIGDFFFHDISTGVYKKSVTLEGIPIGDVGVFLAAKFMGAQETAKTYTLCKGGQFFGEKAINLTGDVLLFTPKFWSDDKKFIVRNENVRFDAPSGRVLGDFDIISDRLLVEHVFLRLARRDVNDYERCIDEVSLSRDVEPTHVQFLDDAFIKKTAGVWGYKGSVSVKDKERGFLSGFIDQMAWETLSLKELSDQIERAKEWDCVSLLWNRSKSLFSKRYDATKSALLNLLLTFEQKFGTFKEMDAAKLLLGDQVVSLEAINLFFDFCFLLLGGCENRMESIGAFDMFTFEMKQSLDVAEMKGVTP